jgi:hypothetical protein
VVHERQSQPWHPFSNRIEFEVADFLYRRNQMSAGDIDHLMKLWSATLEPYGDEAPFAGHRDLYDSIDALSGGGGTSWESFIINIADETAGSNSNRSSWMDADYQVWYRDPQALIQDLLANRSFADEFDYAPYHEYEHGQHRFSNFMSGDWAWRKAVSFFFLYFKQ